MLFEGPAVFYNIHILPLFAIGGVVLLQPLEPKLDRQTQAWLLMLASIVLSIFVIISQERVGSVGSRLSLEDKMAINSLLDPLRSKTAPPLILTDQPAYNALAHNEAVRLMTNHLLLFGEENKPLADILREKRVNYLLLYSTVLWQSPFRQIADSLTTLVGVQVGTLTDQARTYDEPDWRNLDTLRLYRTSW